MVSAGAGCRVVVVLIVLLLCDAIHPLGAQQPQPGRDPSGDAPAASATSLAPITIRINAVVMDRRGRPVLDLTPADFELHDNGVPQTLSSAVLHSASSARPTPPAPILSAQDEEEAAREPDTRLFAVFLDEFHVSAGEHTTRVRDTMTRFVDEELRPTDLLLVMKPLDSVSNIRFTRDRDKARSVIASFDGRKEDYAPRSAFEEQFFGRTPEAVEMGRTQIVTNMLREITMSIGDLRATRAALVLVSEGFTLPRSAERRRLPDWQTLARAAGHFNLPVYTLDPSDAAPAPTQQSDGARAPSTLRRLAAETGGEAAVGPADMVPALGRMARDLDAYYVLAYEPSQATDGTFHAIEVRTKRKDAQVRTPSGYWSPLSREWREWLSRANAPPVERPVRAVRRSPLIATWIGFTRNDDGAMRLLFTWEPSDPVSGPRRSTPQTVGVKISKPDGTALYDGEIAPVRIPAEGETSRDLLALEVPSGRLQLDLEIRSADGSVIDKGAQDVDVPTARGVEPVLLPLQIVRARTARDFRALSTLPDAAPSPSREYSRTERLLIRAPAYDPRGLPVTVTVALVNRRGEKMTELPRVPAAGQTNVPSFDLPLAWLAPGEYGIDVTVTSASGSSRQLIRFRLTG